MKLSEAKKIVRQCYKVATVWEVSFDYTKSKLVRSAAFDLYDAELDKLLVMCREHDIYVEKFYRPIHQKVNY